MEKNKDPKKAKKEEELKKTEEEMKKIDEEIERILQDVEEQFGIERKNLRVVKVEKKTTKKLIIESLFSTLINIVLIMSISGYLEWAKYTSIWHLFAFALIFSTIEMLLSFLIMKYAGKIVMRSFGLVLGLPAILALAISVLSFPLVEVINVTRLIIMFSILIIIRVFIKNNLTRRKFHERKSKK